MENKKNPFIEEIPGVDGATWYHVWIPKDVTLPDGVEKCLVPSDHREEYRGFLVFSKKRTEQ